MYSTQDHVFSLKQAIEKTKSCNMYMAFLDLERAFDTVPQSEIWKSMKNRHIDDHLIEAIRSVYSNNKAYIVKHNERTAMIDIGGGLRQGEVSIPLLFIMLLDDILGMPESNNSGMHIGYHKLRPVKLSMAAFADDQSEAKLQQAIQQWNIELSKRKLRINTQKTKIMVTGRPTTSTNVVLNGEQIEEVDVFKYLGVKIHKEGNIDLEINERVENAAKVYHCLKRSFLDNRKVSKETKLTVYKTIFRPVLIYGSESWVLTPSQKSRVQAIDMKFLRAIKRVTKLDCMPINKIREDLEVEPILERIENIQLKWFGHLNRMSEQRQVRMVWQARSSYKNNSGRPMKIWSDGVATNLLNRGADWNSASQQSRNKKDW